MILGGEADLRDQEDAQSPMLILMSTENSQNSLSNSKEAGAFTVTGGTLGSDYTYKINNVNNTLTINDGANLTIKNTDTSAPTTDQIVVANNATVTLTLSGVNIDDSKLNAVCALKVGAGATCNLIIADQSTNILKSGSERAGIQVPNTTTLNIGGTGTLIANGGAKSAGIGGGGSQNDSKCGVITISGGSVTAVGGDGATSWGGSGGAGIGGGVYSAGGNITISGGTVNATGGSSGRNGGAGIGGAGGNDYGNGGAGGTIIIEGGIVKATGGGVRSGASGGMETGGGAGIGGGSYGGSGGTISIKGGTVTAIAGVSGAGIGGGSQGRGGIITIEGGTVTATSDLSGAGIGGGISGAGGTITIEGGTVTATGGEDAAGIGGGDYAGTSGTIIINGGSVEAVGGTGIGGGDGGDAGTITIAGGSVKATGGEGAGIGAHNGAGGTITIKGGTVNASSSSGAGIGSKTDPGTFSTSGGQGFIVASSISDQKSKDHWSGVIFEGQNDGKIYGDSVKLDTNAEIPPGKTLIVDDGKTLTVKDGATLTVKDGATLTVKDGATLDNKGSIAMNQGGSLSVADNGNIQNSGVVSKADQKANHVAVSSITAAAGGAPLTITPLDVKDNPVVIYSTVLDKINGGDASDVASISGSAITLKKVGTFYVKAEIKETIGYNTKTVYSDQITVTPHIWITKVSLNKSALTLQIGDGETLYATVAPENATNKTVTWTSGNPFVAKVDASGKVTAKNSGTTVITATAEGKTATCKLTVPQIIGSGSGSSSGSDSGSGGGGGSSSGSSMDSSTTSSAITPAPVAPEQPDAINDASAEFLDIENHWAEADIDFVVNQGLFSGTSNTTFSPDAPMTRGMFVTVLGRLAGITPGEYDSSDPFADVSSSDYYAPYVTWAVEKDMVSGTSQTTFSPDQPISREEMAVMMNNYVKAMGDKLPQSHQAVSFSDSNAIAGWAADAVQQMEQAGIISGRDTGAFDPTATTTRAEAASVLHRFVDALGK